MPHLVINYTNLIGAAICPRENCPCQDHEVWFLKNEKGETVKTVFKCKLCGACDPPGHLTKIGEET